MEKVVFLIEMIFYFFQKSLIRLRTAHTFLFDRMLKSFNVRFSDCFIIEFFND